jgi:hypothetical protein
MGETLRSGATVISFFTWPRVSAVRQEGLLTTVSDERSGKPAHSRRSAPRPLRPVFLNPAPSRGPVGSITLQAKVRRPYAKALRGVETRKAPRRFRPARTQRYPWVSSFGAMRKTGRRWPLKPPRPRGGATASVRLDRLPASRSGPSDGR